MKTLTITIFYLILSISVISQQEFVIESGYLVEPDTIWVFTPENSDKNHPLPLIYLLHGSKNNI